ncbi:LacI family DNA-binding transcriptional regulator [Pseudarthrobacter sp. WHRI 8279]|uniref:LacI family DNA-binding transcriptional regulator n=1 Tax=Pseudarthrobacter sp. WHRI 8279 TaxID=3162566 RepID=UPI0032ED2643
MSKDAAGKRPTIVDVARHAGVSTAAASKVLRNAYGVSPQMKAKVQASMKALGYRPLASARGMRGRTQAVAVVVADLHNEFSSLLVEGIRQEAERQKYRLLVAPAGSGKEAQNRMVEDLIDRGMDGIVLISPLGTDAELETLARSIPLVVLGRHASSSDYDSVAADDFNGANLVVDHLVSLGHRRITYVNHTTEGTNDARLPEEVRVRGYVDAMIRHGLGDAIDIIQSQWSQEGGEQAGTAILSRADRPTAVFAGCDVAAFGVLTTMWNARISVPNELSIVGFDNIFTTSLAPISITTVDQSGLDMGAAAGKLLLERVGGRTEPVNSMVQPTLVARNTTAAPVMAHRKREP